MCVCVVSVLMSVLMCAVHAQGEGGEELYRRFAPVAEQLLAFITNEGGDPETLTPFQSVLAHVAGKLRSLTHAGSNFAEEDSDGLQRTMRADVAQLYAKLRDLYKPEACDGLLKLVSVCVCLCVCAVCADVCCVCRLRTGKRQLVQLRLERRRGRRRKRRRLWRRRR